MHYYRLNFASVEDAVIEEASAPPEELSVAPEREAVRDLNARLVRARLVDEEDRTVTNVEQGQPIRLDAVFEAARELLNPIFVLQIRNPDGLVVWGSSWTLEALAAEEQQVRLHGEIENRLVPGSYTLECWIRRDRETGDMAVQGVRLAGFVVYGTASRHGIITLDSDIQPTLEPPGR
jgi:hypothetical protein